MPTSPRFPARETPRAVSRFVEHTLDGSDRIAIARDRLLGAADPQPVRRQGRVALWRTQSALERTEATLAQTARHLQRTAGALAPLSVA